MFVCVLFTVGARAQSMPPNAIEPAYVMTDKGLVGGLMLDTLQRSRLVEVEREYEHDMDAVASNDTISDVMANEYAKQLTATRQKRIRAILTPEQFDQWSRMVRGTRSTSSPQP